MKPPLKGELDTPGPNAGTSSSISALGEDLPYLRLKWMEHHTFCYIYDHTHHFTPHNHVKYQKLSISVPNLFVSIIFLQPSSYSKQRK